MTFSTSSAVFRWKPAAWLRVTGEDAATFLQGQFTNELRGLQPGGAVYGLWLTLKGKVLADSFVIRGGAGAGSGKGDTGAAGAAEFWIGSYFSPGAVIKERLEAYVIADDVTIEDVTAEWAGVTLLGDAAAKPDLGRWSVEVGALAAGPGFAFCGRRGGEALEWVYPVAHAEAAALALAGRPEVDAEEMARRRIAAGVPAVPADIGPGDLPGEGALEAEAISYTKGCYLGQEVMARLKSMGQVRRRLLRVAGEGAAPAVPGALFVGDKKAGELRSVVGDGAGGWAGLAMVTLLQVGTEGRLALEAGGAATIRLVDTP